MSGRAAALKAWETLRATRTKKELRAIVRRAVATRQDNQLLSQQDRQQRGTKVETGVGTITFHEAYKQAGLTTSHPTLLAFLANYAQPPAITQGELLPITYTNPYLASVLAKSCVVGSLNIDLADTCWGRLSSNASLHLFNKWFRFITLVENNATLHRVLYNAWKAKDTRPFDQLPLPTALTGTTATMLIYANGRASGRPAQAYAEFCKYRPSAHARFWFLRHLASHYDMFNWYAGYEKEYVGLLLRELKEHPTYVTWFRGIEAAETALRYYTGYAIRPKSPGLDHAIYYGKSASNWLTMLGFRGYPNRRDILKTKPTNNFMRQLQKVYQRTKRPKMKPLGGRFYYFWPTISDQDDHLKVVKYSIYWDFKSSTLSSGKRDSLAKGFRLINGPRWLNHPNGYVQGTPEAETQDWVIRYLPQIHFGVPFSMKVSREIMKGLVARCKAAQAQRAKRIVLPDDRRSK